MALNEAETRLKLIDPQLHKCGWSELFIHREVILSEGKIIDHIGNRIEKKKADYVLYYEGLPIAIVEAKDELHSSNDGIQQSKQYAIMLDVPFAFSTNGHKIEEFNFLTNKQTSIASFPPPKELWQRYLSSKSFNLKTKTDSLLLPSFISEEVPRYYQEVAIKKCIESFLNGKKRILLTMATGSGKTFVAFEIIWKLFKSKSIHKVLYIADRKFLRDQAYNYFEPFGDARDIIKEGNSPKNRDIYFTTYQSLFSGNEKTRLFEKYEPSFFDLIVIDEAHRSRFGMWHVIFKRFFNALHFGMTATPKRDDNIDTYAYFGEPVYSFSLGQGIEDGFLAPYKIHKIFTNIDKEGILYLRQAQDIGANIYIPEGANVKDYYTVSEFEQKITLPDRTKKICEHLSDLLHDAPISKTMVFCVNMNHAGEVAKELQNHFSYLGYSDYAVRIVSEEVDVKSFLERFVDSEKITPVVATTVDLLSTGVDVPSVKNIVLLSPISSQVLFKQIVGRGSRIDQISKKYEFRIIDYTNATRLFDDWDYPISLNEKTVFRNDPRNKFLTGVVLDSENGLPISKASLTVQVGPNEQIFIRTDDKGRFSISNLPAKINVRIYANNYKDKTIDLESFENLNQSIVIELKKKQVKEEKIIIDNLPIYISEEIKLEIADGRTLTKAQYIEYSKEEIRKRIVSLEDLRRLWSSHDKRKKFLEELKQRSISPKVISEMILKSDVDTFDIISHIAFDAIMITRDDRAKAFNRMKSDFINSLGSGKDIILALLEKYRISGIESIADPKVYNTSPFDQMGYIKGIIEKVGGLENLKKIITKLETDLYKEDEK